MKKNLQRTVMILIMVLSVKTIAQEYKFRKVSKEELKEKSYPLDSSANAAVLYENKKVYFQYDQLNGFKLITEVHKRVKLYTKDGFDYASDKILLYKNNSDEERISGLKGFTYSLIDDKVSEVKLKKEGIFTNELSDDLDEVKFTMPGLQEGAVIEYKYKIISPFVTNIDRVFLQYDIPIKQIEVKISAPEYFNFRKFTTGYLPINLSESVGSGKMTITSKTRTGGNVASGPTRTNFSSSNIDYKVNVSNIINSNVPAFIEEPYSKNPVNYLSSVIYELQFIKYPDNSMKNYANSWEDVTRRIYESSSFGGELKKSNYYKKDLTKLLDGISDPSKKVTLIYNFVKNKMNWNQQYSLYTNKGVKKAYDEGTGNSAEINLMLTSMISSAGVDANPVVLSSSERMIALFPTISGFNYVITRVKLPDGGIFYLDATDKYGLPNILPDRVVKGMGRVIAKNGTSQRVTFRPSKPSTNRYSMQCEITNEGIVSGKFNVNHLDYLAYNFRSTSALRDDESKIKRFEKIYGITELEDYNVKGIKEYGKGVSERFNFIVEDQIEVIEDEIFFSPLLFLRDKENIFKSDERQYPIDFGYGFSNMYMVNIKIPEGYGVLEYPESGAFKLPEDMGVFTYRSNVTNGMVQVVVNETINAPIIPAKYYQALKEFYNQVIKKENEQVVLKKI